MKCIKTILALIAVAVLAGCACSPLALQQGNPDTYSRGQAMSPGYVVEGKVVQARKVKISASSTMTGLGATVGGLIGAVASHKKSGALQTVATMLGAAAGAAAGKVAGNTEGNEIVVLLSDDSMRVIVQEPGAITAVAGEKVLLLINGTETRIVGRL